LYSECVTGVKRSYHAPVRAEQARLTRARIVAAAAACFASSGWTGTTVAAIAHAAGVSPQAVHLSVGAKPALLVEAVRSAVAGDDSETPLREREPFRTAYDERLPLGERAKVFASGARRVYDRAGALFLVLEHAAPSEPDVARRWAQARADRLSDCRHLVRTSGRHTSSDARRRSDLLFVQSGPGVHAELTGLGWSGKAYELWLADVVMALLA
jgi:AcrR family transcriptional regulator